jgi:hypothetical protein
MMSQQTQTPTEKAAERIAEGLPGLSLAAKAVGLEDHRRMLHEHAKRVREGFLWQSKQSGEIPGEKGSVMSTEESEMGNIVITGDISLNDSSDTAKLMDALHGKQATATTAQPQASQVKQPTSPWKTALLATGLAAASSGVGAAAYHWLNKSDVPPPVEWQDTDTDSQYDVQKWIPPQQ